MSCHKLRQTFSKDIVVTTNDPDHPTEKLTCKGEILDPYKIVPKSANFGMVSRKSPTKTRKITITRADGGRLKPKLRPIESEHIKAELAEITPGGKYELNVSLNPSLEFDRLKTELTLDTGIAKAPTATIRVHATIAPRVRTIPRRFTVPGYRKEGWEQSLRLLWDDDAPHRILEATIDDPGLAVKVRKIDGEQRVVLSVLPDLKPPMGSPTVKIKTDDSEAPEVKVRVTVGTKPTSHPGKRATGAASPESQRRISRSRPGEKETKASKPYKINP